MENMDIKEQCERHLIELIRDSGLPDPDTIEFDTSGVRFTWIDQKVKVIINLDDLDENDAEDGPNRCGLSA